MLVNAQVFYGEDGQGVMVKIQTWTGGKSIRVRVQHTSTSIFTLIFNMHHVIISTIFHSVLHFLFYRYGKTSLSVFLLASTLGRGQPDSISSIHSYKSLPR